MGNILEFNIYKRKELYGITYQDSEVVPFVYDNPMDCIDELIYFETENFNRKPYLKFLPHRRTIEQIAVLKMLLISQIII